ncbi:MAG: tyrosine-type recombinase/integrase [Roseburia sp.]|nr:tyrosine-type recombinase/integrase [Roseburia sp.]
MEGDMLKEKIINEIIRAMDTCLDRNQSARLLDTLSVVLQDVEFVSINNSLSTELMDNKKLINSFFVCKRIDGLSADSEATYLYTLKNFMEFTHFMPFTKVDTNIIRCFLINLQKRGNRESTCDNNRRNLNSFFQWLEDEDYITKNPCRKIKRIKEPYRIKRFFSEMEIEQLRDACSTRRELALVDLLVSSGLRVGEVSNIKLSDINWEEGSFTVIGKGNKQRKCYMNVKARKHVSEYLDERNKNGVKSNYLFSRERKPYDKAMCKAELGRILKKIGKRCNITDIHIHGIRAYFATNLSDKGIAPVTIQELMGHESYSTTVRYYCNKNSNNAKRAVLTCA